MTDALPLLFHANRSRRTLGGPRERLFPENVQEQLPLDYLRITVAWNYQELRGSPNIRRAEGHSAIEFRMVGN